MDSIDLKERRKAMRVTVIQPEAWLFNEDLRLHTVSETGALLETHKIFGPNDPDRPTEIIFEIPYEIGMLVVPITVVRVNWRATKDKPLHYAVKFNMQPGPELTILQNIIKYIRESQIELVSRRILDEFFGTRPPRQPI